MTTNDERADHPGRRDALPSGLIREEILAVLGLPVARAAEVPGDPVRSGQRQGGPVAGDGPADRGGLRATDTLLAWHDSHVIRQRAGEIDVKRYEPA